ncbi:MAG: ATP-binding cassette domain-containing protein [Thermoprotei archaeon]
MLEVRNVNVWVNSHHILKEVSFNVDDGNVVLLVGPSGSGKSTLLKTLSGVIPSVIKGVVKGFSNPSLEILKRKTMYVHQEPWFFVSTPYVWSEVTGYTPIMSLGSLKEVLEEFKLSQHVFRTTYTLSAGEIQRLAFVIAVNSGKEIILLDEPTSYLDRRNSETLVRFVNKVSKDYGKTFIVVDHDLTLWGEHASKVLYLCDGRLTETSRNPFDEIIDYMTRKLSPPESRSSECMRIRVNSFKFPDSKEPLLTDVSFDVCRGEVVVVKGSSGSGKTTLLKLIASECLRNNEKIINTAGKKCKAVLVPDNPLLYLSSPTPVDEVSVSGLKYLEYLGIGNKAETPIMRLSSGERRRLAIASALSGGYEYVLMDEPTAGLDPLNKLHVIEAIIKATEFGAGFVIASHDSFVEKIANKVVCIERSQKNY